MTVIVYVEGASDKQALAELLRPLLQQKRRENVDIRFIERASKGDILKNGVRKALTILRNRSDFHVVLLPDLYPPHAGGVPHETVEELEEGVWSRFCEMAAGPSTCRGLKIVSTSSVSRKKMPRKYSGWQSPMQLQSDAHSSSARL